jgi:very-short-patch-repair endonuclease
VSQRARDLRRNATEAETALWRVLRSRQLVGAKFRRQQPLGPYIVDFVDFGHRVVVEADGGQHSENARDEARDAWLTQQGFRVLRFWNNDILANPQGVLETIAAELRK